MLDKVQSDIIINCVGLIKQLDNYNNLSKSSAYQCILWQRYKSEISFWFNGQKTQLYEFLWEVMQGIFLECAKSLCARNLSNFYLAISNANLAGFGRTDD